MLWREGLRATVQEIGEAAGIHKASHYHYFATKREILERICYWAAERMHPPLHALRAAGLAPADQHSPAPSAPTSTSASKTRPKWAS